MDKGPAALGCCFTASRSLALACLIACGSARAELPLAHLDVDDGLSHNSVFAITQDRDGFIWLGTADGLNRFDGYGFRVYRQGPAASGGLLGNSVHALFLDVDGRLWVGTELGINRYDPATGTFVHYRLEAVDGARRRRVVSLHQDRAGVIRAGTEAGLFRYAAPQDRFVRAAGTAGVSEFTVAAIAEAPDGSVWCLRKAAWLLNRNAVSNPTLQRVGPDPGPEVAVPAPNDEDPWAFLIDRRGRFWLHYRNPLPVSNGQPVIDASLPAPRISAALELRSGQLWFGTESGVTIRSPRGGPVRHELLDPGNPSWVRNFVSNLFEDAAGSIWISTYAGVYRYDPGARPFEHLAYDPDSGQSLGASAVSAVAGNAETLWIGTFSGGISVLDRKSGEIRHLRHDPNEPSSLPDDVVWHLLLDDDTLWIATLRGVARMDIRTSKIKRVPALSDIIVYHLLRGHDGHLWVASAAGLLRLQPESLEVTRYAWSARKALTRDIPPHFIPTVLWQTPNSSDNSDQLWIGTDSGALYRFDPATGTTRPSLLPAPLSTDGDASTRGVIRDLYSDHGETLWVAHSAGLTAIEPATGAVDHVGIDDGLPGSVVYAVTSDQQGRLWLATNRGLSLYDPARRQVLRNYSRADGLIQMEFNRHARWRDPDGTLYFGGSDGVTWFDPARIRPNTRPPPVVVTEVQKFGAGGIRRINPHNLTRLTLQPSDYGFSIRFAALDFINPGSNRHSYRLKGLEQQWVPADTTRTARYTSLRPGRYTLELRGSNNDGVWSTHPLGISIEILPAFRQTPWFPALLTAAAGLLILLAWRLRVAQLRRLEQVRLAIAADLHDDLSADLGGIGVAAEMLADRREQEDEERELLVEMARSARESGSALRDLIWYINPDLDTLDALVQRQRTIAGVMLQRHDVSIRAQIDDGSRRLPMMTRRGIVLIYKEVLHNIVRHAEASRVTIEIEQYGDSLRVIAIDDGCGFDPEQAGNGLGIGNMRRRARAIGAELRIDSRPGAGTRIELAVPLTEIRDGRGARLRARLRHLLSWKRRS